MRFVVATLLSLFAFASPAFATTVTNVSVDNATPSAATSARTAYRVAFKVTSGLAGSNSIRITLPAGTSAPGWQSGTVRDVTRNADVGSCSNPDVSLVSTCGLFSGGFVIAGDQVVVTLRGVT